MQLRGYHQQIATGLNDAYKVNNIYDMAGNVTEMTMEGDGDHSHVHRGGNYACHGPVQPVSIRHTYLGSSYSLDRCGTRATLYIK